MQVRQARFRKSVFGGMLSLGLVMLVGVAISEAGIIYNGGNGRTVYGVTGYGLPVPGNPTYIGNNVTGRTDILSSPGGTFLTANPVVANNIADTGNLFTPFFSFQIGGGNGNGAFGSGSATVLGPSMFFSLSDPAPGGGSASYMITSWFPSFKVDADGFAGNLGAYLAIGGRNLAQADSSVAALRVEYSLNGGAFTPIPQMVLAANGLTLQGVAIGGSGAVMQNVNGFFRGLSIDNLGPFVLAPGTTIDVVATLTAYADPAFIDSITPDQSLIALTGATLPDFSIANTASPEPGTLGLLGAGLVFLAWWRRAQRQS